MKCTLPQEKRIIECPRKDFSKHYGYCLANHIETLDDAQHSTGESYSRTFFDVDAAKWFAIDMGIKT